MSLETLWPYLLVVLLLFLLFRLLNQTGDYYKHRRFWISWIGLGLALVAVLFYIVLKGLAKQGA